jgi:hypothetical protein
VAVVHLVLAALPVLDIVAVTLLTLHDAINGARRYILAIIVQTTSGLPLFALY